MRHYAVFVFLVLGLWPACAGDVTYTISTVAGGTYCGDGRLAVAAQLASPEGLAIDSAGNLYIADSIDHRVRKIAPGGVISTLAGDGHPGIRGDGGPAQQAQLNRPYGLAADRSGNIYVADLGNARVRKIAPDGVIRTVAGGGVSPPGPDAGDATGARLNQPRNLALDAEGNLYISDFGDHRVYKVTPGGLILRVAGVGRPASAGGGDPADPLTEPLNCPAGLAVDRAGALYVADSGNRRVRKIHNGRISTVPAPDGTLSTPTGIALDGAGDLYVADKTSARVVKLTPGPPRAVAGTGVAAAALSEPRDVVFDAAGNLYVADSRPDGVYPVGTIRKVGVSGLISTIAGDGTFRAPADGGPPALAHLLDPSGIALDAAGHLYIADRLGHRVRRVSSDLIATFAGAGAPGSGGDGGAAIAAQLNGPAGLAGDASGNLWIAESAGSSVRRVNPAAIMYRIAGALHEPPGYGGDGYQAAAARLNSPEHAVADAAGNLYIADTFNHVVRKVTPDGVISTIVGKGVPGYAGDGGPAVSALLHTPSGLCLGAGGALYIADTGNHVIRKVTSSGAIGTFAGTGAPGFGGDGGPATLAQLQRPSRIALDGSGNLYIADSDNHRVRKVTSDGTIGAIAGTGAPGYGGDDGPALAAQLKMPWDVVVDPAGNVFIADRANQLIRKLTPSAPVRVPPGEVFNIVNGASMLPGPVAPGEIVTIFGTNLGPGAASGARLAASGLLDTEVAGTQVLFNGKPAPLLYVQFGQINLQAPYSVAGRTVAEIEIRRDGATVARMLTPVAEAAPGIFAASGGAGQAAAINEDRTLNSPANPAPRGTIVTLYATGEGETRPAGIDGAPAAPPYAAPALPLLLAIGGEPAGILYAGAAPGYAGLMQVNARIPETIPPGSQRVELTIGTARSQTGVTIAVR